MTLDKVKLKTINNQSVIGDGNISVGGSSVDIVTSWSSTTSDSKVPSEKLTKNSLDDKIAKSSTSGLVKNDGTIDTSTYLTSSSLSNYVQKSQTTGLLKNDGTVDTSSYITSSSLPTKTSDLTNDGSDGTNAFVSTNDSRLYDTGWKTVTFQTGYQDYSTTEKLQYRRIGKIVHLSGAFKNNSAFTPNDTVIATISDVDCRPSRAEYSIQQGSGINRFLLYVNANGQIVVGRYGTTSSTQAGAGTWFNCYTTYFVD